MNPTAHVHPIFGIFEKTIISKNRLLISSTGIIRILESNDDRYLFIRPTPYHISLRKLLFGSGPLDEEFQCIHSHQHELIDWNWGSEAYTVNAEGLLEVVAKFAPEDISNIMLFNLDELIKG